MGSNSCHCTGSCNCNQVKDIVYPTREEVKHRHSEETIRHIHPTHTKIINHHTIRNEYISPETTSYENRVNEVEVRGVNDPSSIHQHRDTCEREPVKSYRGDCCQIDSNMSRDHGNCRGGRRRRSWW